MLRTVAFAPMAHDLPLLPTTVVGSYAHPSWFYAAKELMEADRFGPTDVAETFDDAVDRAVADQEQAGLDIISDGEMRRASFVWAFASRMTGLRDAGPLRKMGPMSIDMRSVQETTGPVGVPHGMGAVEEFEYVRTRTDRHIKIPLPGPFALTTFIRPVEHYRDRTQLAEAFVPALNDEIRRLAAAGCKWIQLDEPATPGYAANDPHTAADIARLFNACVEGVSGRPPLAARLLRLVPQAPVREEDVRAATSPTCSRREPTSSCSSSRPGRWPRSTNGRRGRLIVSSVPASSTSAPTTARRPTTSPRRCVAASNTCRPTSCS